MSRFPQSDSIDRLPGKFVAGSSIRKYFHSIYFRERAECFSRSRLTARAYAVRHQEQLDENTDLIGLAAANVRNN